MKKILVLALIVNSGALYGVCACQRPKPQTQQPTVASQENTEKKATDQAKKHKAPQVVKIKK